MTTQTETAAQRKEREAAEKRAAELDARERDLKEREAALAGAQVADQPGDGPRYTLTLDDGKKFESSTGEAYAIRTADGELHLIDSPVSSHHNGLPVIGCYRRGVRHRKDNRA